MTASLGCNPWSPDSFQNDLFVGRVVWPCLAPLLSRNFQLGFFGGGGGGGGGGSMPFGGSGLLVA